MRTTAAANSTLSQLMDTLSYHEIKAKGANACCKAEVCSRRVPKLTPVESCLGTRYTIVT